MGRTLRRTFRGRTVAAVSLSAVGLALALPGVPASAGPAAGVPAGFRASSITWVTPQQGWVVGAVACGDKTCADVIGTTDGGTTWSLAGKVPATITTIGEPTNPGVTDVRFATSQVGWAFGPKLFATTDGGTTWSKETIPGKGKQVLSLAASSTAAYAVVSGCAYANGICKAPLTFWRTTNLTGGAWTQISLDLPVAIDANVSAFGNSVYLIDEQAELGHTDMFYGSTDGRHFSALTVPCNNKKEVGLIQAVPTSASKVALLCDAPIGFGNAFKKVYRSADNGTTDRSAGVLGMNGIQAQLAASPSGNLSVASYSNGSFIYTNDTHKKTWTMPVGMGDGGRGWNDIVYTTNKEAWVVYSPAGFFNGDGVLYVTHDAGNTWAPSPF